MFSTTPDAIILLLYQDSFEIVNPLGSDRKKNHKILRVYFTLGNFFPFCRSNIDHIQLVLLCKEVDFNAFGQEQVFLRLLADLKKHEQEGISIELHDTTVVNLKGTVECILRDNLGSHVIGGVTESSSSGVNFRRYCLVDRADFYEDPLTVGPKRTDETYDEAIHKLAEDDELYMEVGVEHESVFNSLEYFHVNQDYLHVLGMTYLKG